MLAGGLLASPSCWCGGHHDLLSPGLENVVFENILCIANDPLLLPPMHWTGGSTTERRRGMEATTATWVMDAFQSPPKWIYKDEKN